MSNAREHVERLISRSLDRELSASQEAELSATLARDAEARTCFEEWRKIDALSREVLRGVIASSTPCVVGAARMQPWVRTLSCGLAACLAMLVWTAPSQRPGGGGGLQQASAASSWFEPPSPPVDVYEPMPAEFQRPHVRVHDSERDWLIVPGERPNEFFVIEVDRVKTEIQRIEKGF